MNENYFFKSKMANLYAKLYEELNIKFIYLEFSEYYSLQKVGVECLDAENLQLLHHALRMDTSWLVVFEEIQIAFIISVHVLKQLPYFKGFVSSGATMCDSQSFSFKDGLGLGCQVYVFRREAWDMLSISRAQLIYTFTVLTYEGALGLEQVGRKDLISTEFLNMMCFQTHEGVSV
jgi:hypothetical protein